MRKILTLITLLCIAGVFVSFRSVPDPIPVRWSIDRLQVEGRGDSLRVSVDWTFKGDDIDPNVAIVAVLTLRNTVGEARLAPVGIYGYKAFYEGYVASEDERERSYLYESGGISFHCEDSFLYESWMDTLRVSIDLSQWSRRGGLFPVSSAAKWTYTKPKKPEEPVFPWMPLAPKKSNDIPRELEFSSQVTFPEVSSKFDIEDGNNVEEIGDLLDKVKAFTSSKSFDVRSSSLSVSLPPSGDSSGSLKRSRSCAQSLFNYLQRAGAFKVSVPEKVGLGEDWDGVRDWVSRSPYQDDSRLMEILSWKGKDDAMARALVREKPTEWENISERCLPLLGRAVYRASYIPRSFMRPNFVIPVFEELPEALTPYDFYYLSTIYETGSDKWLEVMTTGAKFNPSDEHLCMDVAMAYSLAGNPRAAAPFLRNIGESDDAKYVYCVWLFASGRYREALEILDYLREKNPSYGQVWVFMEPLAKWYSNDVIWEKSFN